MSTQEEIIEEAEKQDEKTVVSEKKRRRLGTKLTPEEKKEWKEQCLAKASEQAAVVREVLTEQGVDFNEIVDGLFYYFTYKVEGRYQLLEALIPKKDRCYSLNVKIIVEADMVIFDCIFPKSFECKEQAKAMDMLCFINYTNKHITDTGSLYYDLKLKRPRFTFCPHISKILKYYPEVFKALIVRSYLLTQESLLYDAESLDVLTKAKDTEVTEFIKSCGFSGENERYMLLHKGSILHSDSLPDAFNGNE